MTRVGIEEQTDDGRKVSSHKMAPKSSRVTSMLLTDRGGCIDDNYKMLVTIFAIFVKTYYLFTLASITNIRKMSSTSKKFTQNYKLTSLSPISLRKFESYFFKNALGKWTQ